MFRTEESYSLNEKSLGKQGFLKVQRIAMLDMLFSI